MAKTDTNDKLYGERLDPYGPKRLNDLVSYRIRLLQIAAFKSFEGVTTGYGSIPRYYGLLELLSNNPGVTHNRLAEAVYLDKSSLVSILDMLQKEGVIKREPSDTDRRVKNLFITPKGAELLNDLNRHVTEHESMLMAGFSDEERSTLVSMLDKIDNNIRNSWEEQK